MSFAKQTFKIIRRTVHWVDRTVIVDAVGTAHAALAPHLAYRIEGHKIKHVCTQRLYSIQLRRHSVEIVRRRKLSHKHLIYHLVVELAFVALHIHRSLNLISILYDSGSCKSTV